MTIDEAEASLRADLIGAGLHLDGGDVEAIMAAMIDWYARARAEDAVPLDEDGDMLLFQWGPYDPDDRPVYEVGLTRQLIRAGDEDEDERIIQLALTARYAPTDETAGLASGHLWCTDPSGAVAFRETIRAHPASGTTSARTPEAVLLSIEVAG